MIRTLFTFGLMAWAALSHGSAIALTVYTNEADWLTAVAGMKVGKYNDEVTRTDYITTLQVTGGNPSFVILESHTDTITEDFQSYFVDMHWPDNCPISCSAATRSTLEFSKPIFGFAAVARIGHPSEITMNDFPLQNVLDPGNPDFVFFGVVGPFTALDFVSFSGFTDNDIRVNIERIIVATVPEPATLTIFGAGLAGLAARRRRRTAFTNEPIVFSANASRSAT